MTKGVLKTTWQWSNSPAQRTVQIWYTDLQVRKPDQIVKKTERTFQTVDVTVSADNRGNTTEKVSDWGKLSGLYLRAEKDISIMKIRIVCIIIDVLGTIWKTQKLKLEELEI